MGGLQRFCVLVLAALLIAAPACAQAQTYPNYNTTPIAPDSAGMASTATELAARMRLGWNAGNTLEATGGETTWGNPRITRALIARIKESGFDTIRLPVAWNGHADAQTARIDGAWLARVKEVVQLCVDQDMHVLVNVHWDGGWLERSFERNDDVAAIDARQRALWQQIAISLRDFDERVLFASANEPAVENEAQMRALARYHQTFVTAVRESGGKNAYRVLVVQGPGTDIEKTDRLWPGMPNDTIASRLMLEVHYYTPWNFTGLDKDESWGRMFYYWGEGFHSRTERERNASWGEEADAAALFARMKRKFVDQGVPVIIGEFGAMRRTNLRGEAFTLHLASRAHYLETVTRLAASNGMVPIYWDNGRVERGGAIFDRRNNSVSDQQSLDALRRGAGLAAATR